MPENPASYRVVRTKSYLFNKAPFHLYSSYFKLHVLRLELFRVYKYKNQEMADESRARKKELILERSAKSH
ncbi:hypothetical protein EXX01_22475 [Escherichia coli]|nr:hypothetical protein EXX01_22475 [Escherichia coli]